MQQGRKHDAAGGNSEEYQGRHVSRPEKHLKVRTGECIHSMLRDDNVVLFINEQRVNGRKLSLEQLLVLRGGLDVSE